MKIEKGEIAIVSARAVAHILVKPYPKANYQTMHRVTSAGLFGIEHDGSNGSENYLDTVFKEEKNELRAILKEFGFTDKEISAASTESNNAMSCTSASPEGSALSKEVIGESAFRWILPPMRGRDCRASNH